jgi:hypothetical protein
MPVGAFRKVCLLGGFALKVPRISNFRAGMRCNRWERELWFKWRPLFGWRTLCPIYFADPVGLLVVMPKAEQPVTHAEVDALPDYYPSYTSECKVEDHGRLLGAVVAVDYGLGFADSVVEQRKYYNSKSSSPAIILSNDA